MSTHWKTGKLSDLVVFQRGFDITKAEQINGNIPIISSSGITSFHNKAKQTGPAVIIGRKGTLGSVHYYHKEYWPHDTTLWSKELKGYPKFIYYFLKTMKLEQYDVGNANPTLNRNHIHKLNVPIPPLSTQQKIAHILSAYDDLIENNLKRIKLLEEMAQITYEEWFVRMKFPGHEQVVIDSETGLPEGWVNTEIREFGQVITGKTPPTNIEEYYGNDVLFIKTPDMAKAPYVLDTELKLSAKGADTQKGKYLPKNSLLVSCIGSAGVVALTSVSSQLNQQINAVVFDREFDAFFLYGFAKHLKPVLEALGSNGATMTNVNKSKFERIKVITPTDTLLNDFGLKVAPNFSILEKLLQQNQRLKEARDILLPRLMTGMIDVNTLDLPKPLESKKEVA